FPGEEPQQPRPKAARASRLDAMAAFALPVVAVGFGIALEAFERRRGGRFASARPSPKRARSTASLWAQGREFLESPEMRARLANARRTAMEYAAQAAAAQLRGKPRRKSWKPW